MVPETSSEASSLSFSSGFRAPLHQKEERAHDEKIASTSARVKQAGACLIPPNTSRLTKPARHNI